MRTIQLLDDLTINQIAAGEVVEGPLSVVKELVENSIDANSTKIVVEIENGGKKLIKIIDNGKGFDYDDIDIAFERHATSKIRSTNDLKNVMTMGFRGEALASIASVSEVELITKTKDRDIGYSYMIKGGKKLRDIEEINSTQGTTIIIKDLFYNVPVRAKFLKSDNSEFQKIKKIFIRLALANLNISFKLIHNGKVVVNTVGDGNMQSACYSIFGKEVSQNLIEVDEQINDIKINGVIGNTRIEIGNRKSEIFFVNNRSIENEILFNGAEQAFKNSLKIGKFPFLVINITINPETIDTNIHPTKKEIKFQNEKDVFDAIYQAIKASILKEGFLGMDSSRNSETIADEYTKQQFEHLPQQSNKQYVTKNSIKNSDKFITSNINQKYLSGRDSSNMIFSHQGERLNYKLVGVVFKTFIIIEINENNDENNVESDDKNDVVNDAVNDGMKKSLYFIDQHASHERILFEQVKESYNQNKTPDVQMLLVPIVIDLTQSEFETVMDNKEIFQKVGFVFEPFGDNSIKISGVPAITYNIDIKTLFQDTLIELESYGINSKQEIENRFVATIACKAAVKAGMVLSEKEIDEMIQKLWKLPNPYTCPHGRPTTIKIDL